MISLRWYAKEVYFLWKIRCCQLAISGVWANVTIFCVFRSFPKSRSPYWLQKPAACSLQFIFHGTEYMVTVFTETFTKCLFLRLFWQLLLLSLKLWYFSGKISVYILWKAIWYIVFFKQKATTNFRSTKCKALAWDESSSLQLRYIIMKYVAFLQKSQNSRSGTIYLLTIRRSSVTEWDLGRSGNFCVTFAIGFSSHWNSDATAEKNKANYIENTYCACLRSFVAYLQVRLLTSGSET